MLISFRLEGEDMIKLKVIAMAGGVSPHIAAQKIVKEHLRKGEITNGTTEGHDQDPNNRPITA